MRGVKAKRNRRLVEADLDKGVPGLYDKRKIRVGRAYGGPALGAFPYPPSVREGEHFNVLTITEDELRKAANGQDPVTED